MAWILYFHTKNLIQFSIATKTLFPYTHTHTHTMENYSAIKKWNNAIFSNMDGPRDYHTKWSKSDRERKISYDITYVESEKIIQMNLFTKQKQTHRLRKQTYGYQRGKLGGRNKLAVWD